MSRQVRWPRLVAAGAAATALLVGPLAEGVSAGSVQTTVEGLNVVYAETTVYDTGDYDWWEGPWVGEFQNPMNPFNTICASQGYRDFVHETMVPRYYFDGFFSGYKAGCVFGERWVSLDPDWTDELWDMRFGWKSGNTPNNDWLEIGVVDG